MEQTNSIYYSGYRKEMLEFIPADCKKILEIGCSEGNFLNQIKAEDTELWGVEPDIKSAQIAGTKLYRVLNIPIEEALDLLPDHYFDAIVLNDVLEHMLFPDGILKHIKLKLKPGGLIISSIPNFRYIKSLFKVVVKRKWEYADHGILDYTHFRFFTRKSIISMFIECGYEIKNIKGINRTKSIKFHLLAFIFCILTLSNQLDMLYMQFAVVAKLNDQGN
jgi:2-polyprenyl-3-methyl-5-hydroxy-6-metoxy-1,4-benzoquinol methylase